jgi:hypothetical protein
VWVATLDSDNISEHKLVPSDPLLMQDRTDLRVGRNENPRVGDWVVISQFHLRWQVRAIWDLSFPSVSVDFTQMILEKPEFPCGHNRGQMHLEESLLNTQTTDFAPQCRVAENVIRYDEQKILRELKSKRVEICDHVFQKNLSPHAVGWCLE